MCLLLHKKNFDDTDPETVQFCCDVGQIFTMVDGFAMFAPFARCPTCRTNFIQSVCGLTCSPDQHMFISGFVSGEENGNIVDQRTYIHFQRQVFKVFIKLFVAYVEEISVNMDKNYMTGIYESCEKVSSPSTGGLLLDAVCGEYGSTYCTAERWFEYMGSTELNPLTPFDIKYTATINDTGALNRETLKCNEAYDVSVELR